MIRWWRKVREILLHLSELGVEIKIGMVFLYIDDFRIAMTPIPLGYNYNPETSKWTYSEELKEQEERDHITPETKTKQVLLQVMNSVCRDLSWTAESQEDFTDGFLPTLDTKLKLTNNHITYQFF